MGKKRKSHRLFFSIFDFWLFFLFLISDQCCKIKISNLVCKCILSSQLAKSFPPQVLLIYAANYGGNYGGALWGSIMGEHYGGALWGELCQKFWGICLIEASTQCKNAKSNAFFVIMLSYVCIMQAYVQTSCIRYFAWQHWSLLECMDLIKLQQNRIRFILSKERMLERSFSRTTRVLTAVLLSQEVRCSL